MHTPLNIFTKWPSYLQPLGYRLVDLDYAYIYPQSENMLQPWADFPDAIIPNYVLMHI